MNERAQIQAVQEISEGSVLVADAAIAAVTLFLEDVTDFDEDGGTALVGTESVTYTALDDDLNTLTLSVGLAAAWITDTVVQVEPYAVTRFAHVLIDAEGDEGPTVMARIPHTLYDKLALGTRVETAKEWVLLTATPEEWVVADVLGREPIVQAHFSDTSDGGGSDSTAPGSSPAPTVRGGVGFLVVKWTAITNADPLTYEVHLSRTPGFVASSATLAGENAGGDSFFIRTEPDGSPLAYDVVYYVVLIARDVDGSAAQSLEASATLRKIDAQEFAVQSLLAEEILAAALEAGTIISGNIRTGDTGARVVFSGGGFQAYNAAGVITVNVDAQTGNATFTGIVEGSILKGSALYVPTDENTVFRMVVDNVAYTSGSTSPGSVAWHPASASITRPLGFIEAWGTVSPTTGWTHLALVADSNPATPFDTYVHVELSSDAVVGNSAFVITIQENGTPTTATFLASGVFLATSGLSISTLAENNRIYMPAARIGKNTTQGITTTTETKLDWQDISGTSPSNVWDNDLMADFVNERLTATQDGFYCGVAQIGIDTVSANTTQIVLKVRKNGAAGSNIALVDKVPTGGNDYMALPFQVELEIGDYVDVTVQFFGATANSTVGIADTYLAMHLISFE